MTGYINVDKPQGMTSFAVVGRIRKLLGQKRVGHAGTLDPMATGVLPILVGRGTKAMGYLDDEMKVYRATCALGRAYDTEDVWGTPTVARPYCITAEAVEEALGDFTGEIWQVPPMYSALKKNGQKLVDLARSGVVVPREPRKRWIEGFDDVVVEPEAGRIHLTVTCSRGTYIRTLCADLAKALGTVGAMSFLRRTKSHICTLEGSWSLEAVETAFEAGNLDFLEPLDRLFSHHPAIVVPEAKKTHLINGVKIDLSPWVDRPGRLYRLYAGETFVGLARHREDLVFLDKLMVG